MKKKNLGRNVSSSLLSFFLAMMIAGIYLIIGLRMGMFGTTTVETAMKESNYYEESYHRFQDQIAWYLSESELSREVVNDTVTLQQFYLDARTQMQGILESNPSKEVLADSYVVNREDLVTKLREAYAKQYVVLTEDQLATIDQVADVVMELYQEQMDFPLVKSIRNAKIPFTSYSTVIMIGLLVLSSLTIALLLKMYRHKHKALRYVTYSMLSASGMILLFVLLIRQRIDYRTIPTDHGYYQKFIETFTKESEIAFLFPAGGGILLCCLLLILMKEMRKRAIGE